MFRKRIRMVLRRRKMPFWNQCWKQYTENPKNLGPYSGNDFKKNHFWQNTDSLQNDHLYKQKTILTNVPEVFGKILEIWGSNPKQSQEILFSFRETYPLEMTLSSRRSQFWKPCRTFFPPKMRFIMPKVQKP